MNRIAIPRHSFPEKPCTVLSCSASTTIDPNCTCIVTRPLSSSSSTFGKSRRAASAAIKGTRGSPGDERNGFPKSWLPSKDFPTTNRARAFPGAPFVAARTFDGGKEASYRRKQAGCGRTCSHKGRSPSRTVDPCGWCACFK